MQNHSPSRPVLWGIALLLGIGLCLPAQELPAQNAGGCSAVDINDLPRNCTFLEEHGGCLWNALDSYGGCRGESVGFLGRVSCEVGVQVDLLACNLGLPWRLLRTIIT